MSSFDSLPPDQRAVLQLVLGQGRTYEDLAGMLGIEALAVRARAVGAAEALGPDAGRLAPERRAEIVDFLLAQGSAGQRQATRDYLSASAGGRAWARAVAGELRPLDLGALPEIPDEAAAEAEPADEPADTAAAAPRPARARRREPASALEEPAAAPPPARERRSSSRIGGALLLAGVGIVVAVVLIIVIGGGGDDKGSTQASTSTTPATQTATTAPRPEAQVNLRGPNGELGVAQIVSQQGQRAMALVAQGMPASPAGYAVWLYNSPRDLVRLGFTQPVGKDGKLSALSPLPKNASRYRELIISRETAKQPKTPTRVALRGPLKLS